MRLLIALALVSAAPLTPAVQPAAHPEAALYDPARTAQTDVDAALARATTANQLVILVMGANWCHDSKGLAGWFETPRFKAMLAAKYQIVFIDVGKPQTGKGRNIDVAQRFGIKKIKGTPTVLILSPGGKLLNKKDAPGWRNAASRSEDDIYRYFADFGGTHDKIS